MKRKKLRACDYCGGLIGFEYRINHWAPINSDGSSHECEQYMKSSTKKILCQIAVRIPDIEQQLHRIEKAITGLKMKRNGTQEKDSD